MELTAHDIATWLLERLRFEASRGQLLVDPTGLERVRAALRPYAGPAVETARLSTPFDTLISRHRRQHVWNAFQRKFRARLPALTLPRFLQGVLFLFFVLALMVSCAFVLALITSPNPKQSLGASMAQACICLLVLFIAGAIPFVALRTIPIAPDRCRTMADLVAYLAPATATHEYSWTYEKVWLEVREILGDVHHIREEDVVPATPLERALGMQVIKPIDQVIS